jgi:two-component system sensor histidine kinase KdpD
VVALIVAISFIEFDVLPVNSTTAALTLLLAILWIAAQWGLTEASIASVTGMLCFNYFFLPPVQTFTIADPQNWIALFAFLATAITASQLSGRARRRAEEASAGRQEMERLYLLSRALLLLQYGEAAASAIAFQISRCFGNIPAALFESASGRVYSAGGEDLSKYESKLRDAAIQMVAMHENGANVHMVPVALGGRCLGSLAVRGGSISDAALHAIANLAAITMERIASEDRALRAETARRSQELKSTMMDAFAHEFRTPLTTIKAAISGLLAEDSVPGRELLGIVEEEADRLSDLVSEAIQTASIEAGDVRLERAALPAAELVENAIRSADRALQNHEIRVSIDPGLPALIADGNLIELTIRQLLNNAAKYANPDSPVEISARTEGEQAVISVRDFGPGIPEAEQARIFERFYRGKANRASVPGAGIGLAIAREVVELHGGSLSVASEPGKGSEFRITLPLALAEASQ